MTAMICNHKVLFIISILLLADPEHSEAKPTPSNVLNGEGKKVFEELLLDLFMETSECSFLLTIITRIMFFVNC